MSGTSISEVFDPEIRERVNHRVEHDRRSEVLSDTVLALLRCLHTAIFRKLQKAFHARYRDFRAAAQN
jgi:hypothetical protein